MKDKVICNNAKILEEKLSHASGALSDIIILVTSCVPKEKKGNEKFHDVAESILLRILCSAHKIQHKPSWYIHDWEKKAYEDYFNKKINACASENASIDEAERLNKLVKPIRKFNLTKAAREIEFYKITMKSMPKNMTKEQCYREGLKDAFYIINNNIKEE